MPGLDAGPAGPVESRSEAVERLRLEMESQLWMFHANR